MYSPHFILACSIHCPPKAFSDVNLWLVYSLLPAVIGNLLNVYNVYKAAVCVGIDVMYSIYDLGGKAAIV